MNDLAKNAWAFFLASLIFGVWTIPILIAWAIVCYVIHYRKEKRI